MRFIETYYTRDAYERNKKPAPSIAFIIETGEVIYNNEGYFSLDFNEDFFIMDESDFMPYFKFYR